MAWYSRLMVLLVLGLLFFNLSSFGSIVHNTVSNRGPSHDDMTLALLRNLSKPDQL